MRKRTQHFTHISKLLFCCQKICTKHVAYSRFIVISEAGTLAIQLINQDKHSGLQKATGAISKLTMKVLWKTLQDNVKVYMQDSEEGYIQLKSQAVKTYSLPHIKAPRRPPGYPVHQHIFVFYMCKTQQILSCFFFCKRFGPRFQARYVKMLVSCIQRNL